MMPARLSREAVVSRLKTIVKARSKNPILVYQMGKVGSKTVTESLQAAGLRAPIYHVHFLSEVSEARFRGKAERGEDPSSSEIMVGIRNMRRKVLANDHKRWKVITLVREPIARGIATFIASYFKTNPVFGIDDSRYSTKVATLRDLFAQRGHKYDEYASTWFETELRALFGLDVFATDFPKGKGYAIYSAEKADVLLIRLEDLDRCHLDAFEEFLDIENLRLVSANVAREKGHYPVYREFVRTVEFSAEFLEETYSGNVVRHFYTPDEISGFITQWSRTAGAPGSGR